MKLQHALGGLEGLETTPVNFEKRVFVEDWEKRIFGIHAAMMGLSDSLRDAGYDMDAAGAAVNTTWTWADLRKGAEAMNPFDYFRLRYYEKWLGGITSYFLQHGYVTEEELAAATATYAETPTAELPVRPSDSIDDQVIRYLRQGDTPLRGPGEPRFAAGDAVTIGNPPHSDHTRLPGYLRGRSGVIERVWSGSYAYFCSTGPDGLGEQPVPVYVVRFEPAEVWGAAAEPNAGPIYVELYETYLNPPATTEDVA